MTDWTASACLGKNPEDWFPDRNSSGEESARRVCYGCPIKTGCAQDAINQGEEYGIRAGIWIGKDTGWRTNLHKMAGMTPPIEVADARKVCRQGHDLTGEGATVVRGAVTRCTVCSTASREAEYARRRAARLAAGKTPRKRAA